VTLGLAVRQGTFFDEIERFCDKALDETSIYAFMHRERDRLFPMKSSPTCSTAMAGAPVPPSVVATVMVLQRLEGLSDREAVERYCYDNRCGTQQASVATTTAG